MFGFTSAIGNNLLIIMDINWKHITQRWEFSREVSLDHYSYLIIVINNISKYFLNSLVDDLKNYRIIGTSDDNVKLQEDLDELVPSFFERMIHIRCNIVDQDGLYMKNCLKSHNRTHFKDNGNTKVCFTWL